MVGFGGFGNRSLVGFSFIINLMCILFFVFVFKFGKRNMGFI